MHTEGSQEPSYAEIYKENPAPWGRDICFVRACAVDTWTCDKSHFMPQFTGKMPQTKSKQKSRRRLRASLCNRHAYGHGTRMKKGHFAEIQRENPAPQSEHLDQAPASTLTVRISECGHAAQIKGGRYFITTNSPHLPGEGC